MTTSCCATPRSPCCWWPLRLTPRLWSPPDSPRPRRTRSTARAGRGDLGCSPTMSHRPRRTNSCARAERLRDSPPQQHALEGEEVRRTVTHLGDVARPKLVDEVVPLLCGERTLEPRQHRPLHPLDSVRGRGQMVRVDL